jgi:hypothetical protein
MPLGKPLRSGRHRIRDIEVAGRIHGHADGTEQLRAGGQARRYPSSRLGSFPPQDTLAREAR